MYSALLKPFLNKNKELEGRLIKYYHSLQVTRPHKTDLRGYFGFHVLLLLEMLLSLGSFQLLQQRASMVSCSCHISSR